VKKRRQNIKDLRRTPSKEKLIVTFTPDGAESRDKARQLSQKAIKKERSGQSIPGEVARASFCGPREQKFAECPNTPVPPAEKKKERREGEERGTRRKGVRGLRLRRTPPDAFFEGARSRRDSLKEEKSQEDDGLLLQNPRWVPA